MLFYPIVYKYICKFNFSIKWFIYILDIYSSIVSVLINKYYFKINTLCFTFVNENLFSVLSFTIIEKYKYDFSQYFSVYNIQ